jgi:hypothetical protein
MNNPRPKMLMGCIFVAAERDKGYKYDRREVSGSVHRCSVGSYSPAAPVIRKIASLSKLFFPIDSRNGSYNGGHRI